MQIVCKKKLQFTDYEISINPLNGEKIAKLVRSFIAGPSLRTIEAPDWIVNDDLFQLAMADGSLVPAGEIPVKEPKPVIEAPSQPIAQVMRPASEISEADIELLNRPISELIDVVPQETRYPTTSTGWPSTKSI